MIHKNSSNLFRGIVFIFAFAMAALTACSNEASTTTSPNEAVSPVSERSASVVSEAAGQDAVQEEAALPLSQVTLIDNTIPAIDSTLSDSEEAALLIMREEEKLARDLYLTFYEQWGLPLFQNIASSEQAHTDAIKALIEQYGLTDPAASSDVGEFTNPDLQALFEQLKGEGLLSLSDALRVGAAVEEIDIIDLEYGIAGTNNPNLIRVYENLKAGSENHLRAFVSTLERQTGETAEAQYLDQTVFENIISSASGNGQGYRGGRSEDSESQRGNGWRNGGGAPGNGGGQRS